MSLASVASQQNAALQLAANQAASGVAASGLQGAASGTAATSSNSATALNALSGNFSDFLNLLMTQLKNQDPSSPLDTNQFTTQLVQFAGVAQQITTNQSLTQLIQLTQSGEILNSSSIVGKQVAVTSSQMPLQNGSGQLQFTPKAAGPIAIAVYGATGQQVATATVQATAGVNTWSWNGEDANGDQLPDGAYNVAVMGLDASGNATAVPFSVIGTATGVQSQNGAVSLQMGKESVNFSAVQSVITGS
jgi:flagellar basal-body rod modification protein FlgD